MAGEVKVKLGIKETKEALIGLGALAVVARKAYRQAGGDVAKIPMAFGTLLVADVKAMAAIKAGYEDAGQIVPEVKDLDPMEFLEIGTTSLDVIRTSFIEVQG